MKKQNVRAHADVDARELARLREQVAEELALDLGGSLNLRRTALRLLAMIQPRMADWAMAVVPDSGTGELIVLGAAPSGIVVSGDGLADVSLGRVLSALLAVTCKT
ncbi:hypothetical protein [Mycobacterium sp. URHB0021]